LVREGLVFRPYGIEPGYLVRGAEDAQKGWLDPLDSLEGGSVTYLRAAFGGWLDILAKVPLDC
jgi:hypothetical protein